MSIPVKTVRAQPVAPKTQAGDVTAQRNPMSGAEPIVDAIDAIPHEEIARRAYLRAEQRGFVPGHECDDWLAAESELVDFWFTEQRRHSNS